MLNVALVGAGGKMGMRVTHNLARTQGYSVSHVETAPAGVARLAELGCTVTPGAQAVAAADITVLAVPDAAIGRVSASLVASMRPGSTVILLDPAAAAAGELALRDGLTYIVTHPCHPPLFGDETSPEARKDFFGGVAAKQDIVIALMRGSEKSFLVAQELCRAMFAPVVTVHRITVDQMALLEPAMAEVVAAAAAVLMREALEEAVKAGVPRPAATAFMLGHAQIPLAIAFGAISSPFSDAAKIAIAYGKKHVIREDWRDVFKPAHVAEAIRQMLHPGETR